jgi:hypothetical protein
MFVGTDVIEFINKIINQSDVKDKDKVKQNITKFREYLRLTCMCDETTLTDIDLILSCIDELMILKSKLGIVDVMSIFEGREETKQPRRLAKTRQSLYDEKHYRHYSSNNNSSCGSSSPSYSSSCGGGTVNRRC